MATSKLPAEMKTAGDVMATRLTTVFPDVDVATAIRALVRHNVSGMPVVDSQGQYVGMFSEKSSLKALTHVATTLQQSGQPAARAGDFMVTRLVRLAPDQEVFEAIGCLLKHRVSGAPVVDADGMFLGVFSEKDSMSVLIKAAYEQLPGGEVSVFMNPDPGRIISVETDLLTIANMFVNSPYRRLTVVQNGILQGQISRRDVLRNSRLLASIVRDVLAMAASEDSPVAEVAASASGYSDSSDAARDQLSATSVARFMDAEARTITEDADLLTIAQIFFSTPYRRLPVIRDGQLVGQVSRRDILASVYSLIEPVAADREQSLLYLSGVLGDGEAIPKIQ
jgi:CBS domain-containing protein